jgi:ABC-2 type transport system permease protein
VVWPQFIAIALIGATFFGITLTRFRWTIGSMA